MVKTKEGPKRNVSAYFHFSKKERANLPAGLSFGETGKELSNRWKATTEDDKAPFEAAAVKDKARYLEEKAKWVKDNPDKQLGGKKVKEVDPSKPKVKRRLSGYQVYMKDARASVKADNPDLANPQIMTEIAKRWKALSDEEQQVFKDTAARL
jgi:hypothetical protein